MAADIQKTIEIIFGTTDNTGNLFKNIGDDLNSFEASVGSVSGPIAGLTKDLLLTEAAVIGLGAAYAGFAVSKAIEFQDAQIDLGKVLSENDPKIESFTDTVIELSEQYGVSAASILQGIANFKQAGFTAEESALLQKNALDLIIAGDVEAARATEILVASLKGFGAEATDSARFIEALNNVSNKYATDLGELAGGMSKISPIAKAMGFSFEETTGLITPIIEVFRSGDEAANALKTGLLKLLDDSKPVGDALAKIGVSQFDLNGQMRSGKEIFLDVAAAFQTLDENQKLVTTSQLVGINQAGKMVKVFDNLALSQKITSDALKNTGSATEEVALRLASAGKQVDRTITTFNNLAAAVGTKLLPGFTGAADGTQTLLVALRKLVSDGGLDPFIDKLSAQGVSLQQFFIDIAEVLPEAFNDVDLSGLIDSFDNLKESIGGLFGDLDLTKQEDLTAALQGIVDFLGLLTNASAGAVTGLSPLIDGIVQFLNVLGDTSGESQSFIGEIGGIVTSIDTVLPLLGFLADAVTLVGGAILAIGGLQGVKVFTGMATSLAALAPLSAALGAAVASVTFAVTENIDAYEKLQQQQNDLASSEANTLDNKEKLVQKLKEVSDATGIAVTSIEELNRAEEDGLIVFNSVTQAYESTKKEITDYSNVVKDVAEASLTSAETTEQYAAAMKELGFVVDPVSGAIQTIASAAEHVGAAQEAATQSARGYKIELVDGVTVFTQVGAASTGMAQQLTESADAMDELSDRERLAIEQSHELEQTLLELASNETIASMEFTASINVAQIKAQAEQVVAAFDASASAITALSESVSSIYETASGVFNDEDRRHLNEAAERQERRLQEELNLKRRLTNSEINKLDAQAAALREGGSMINITADNLAPELQQVLRSLVDNIRLEAVNAGLEILL